MAKFVQEAKQEAKSAMNKILSKDGQHDTSVHEKVMPAVTNEDVHSVHVEKGREVVDREVHQDHYHTSVQPIKDSEQKSTVHHDNVVPTQEREFVHGDKSADAEVRAAEDAKFNDTRTVHETNSVEQKATVGAERVHHHVHETIQPVINKQTIEPHVTHTTIPIHEVHHNAGQHHQTSALPAVSMKEYKEAGGVVGGRGLREDKFDGAPKGISTQSPASATFDTGRTGI